MCNTGLWTLYHELSCWRLCPSWPVPYGIYFSITFFIFWVNQLCTKDNSIAANPVLTHNKFLPSVLSWLKTCLAEHVDSWSEYKIGYIWCSPFFIFLLPTGVSITIELIFFSNLHSFCNSNQVSSNRLVRFFSFHFGPDVLYSPRLCISFYEILTFINHNTFGTLSGRGRRGGKK